MGVNMKGLKGMGQLFIDYFIQGLSWLLPSLERFTVSEWLVYSNAGLTDLLLVIVQTVIYVVLISSAALFDLYRKSI